MTCPSVDDLYDFFSRHQYHKLDPDIKAGIEIHVSMCQECADAGKGIQKSDEILDDFEVKPLTDEEKAMVERHIAWLKKRTVN